ncbi:MAG: outer membrane lipoprotein-sorting protein [Bdellovibrionales bacterium RIFOXYD12_FULL_39_22]|nr:MAG: outer membrane lipoprotein-sorting protein [Bdellovibrionales bacterium RIFOXYB1_FULL_39_21]OFZ42706.1 MAG: outer membrane lipoprotein-sorting protein [Bdellovibrionales bacterium RIFOXYC12_FULL_39_17]OFZ47265.1 MAG: outer membrane lipoprotein-sorting protein [Bdellovibrionales bacterium RIFOXYC1_FULL_39_130]OFZ73677.1 MAG: outer membrane lipoprotein-sorting protein [Bdellovibrionales bacterium RIFOXYC2_FULL_39_8]OFZ75431.1 MAG: outer membrane lipoprotein-sorting protein [Bdellovibriona
MNHFFVVILFLMAANLYALTEAETSAIIKTVDDLQRNSGDYTSLCYIKDTEKGKEPRLNQALVYRRDTDNKFMILFTKPKEDAGKGYLKIDKNLWNYEPSTGKWDRKTERERIGGTNSRRGDFDESKLSEEFTAVYDGDEKLGDYDAYKFTLAGKNGVDVPYPVLKLWVDKASKNILKREEYSLSKKLMRTSFYPKWMKKFSPSKKSDVWIPEEIRIFDELEKGNTTIILIKEVDLNTLPENMFTKAWVESKSK